MNIDASRILDFILTFGGAVGASSIVSSLIVRKITKCAAAKEAELEEEKAKLAEQIRINNLNTNANKIVLRSIIYSMHNTIKDRNYMWLYELEQLDETFTTYDGLGGNGSAHKIYEDTKNDYEVVTSPEQAAALDRLKDLK